MNKFEELSKREVELTKIANQLEDELLIAMDLGTETQVQGLSNEYAQVLIQLNKVGKQIDNFAA